MNHTTKSTTPKEEGASGDQRSLCLVLQGSNLQSVPGAISYKPSWDMPEETNPNRMYRISKFQPGDDNEVYKGVYESEVVVNTADPLWKETMLPLNELCNENCDLPLQISVWEHSTDKTFGMVPMGTCETTVAELIRTQKSSEPSNSLNLYRGERFMGSLHVLEARISEPKTNTVTSTENNGWASGWGILDTLVGITNEFISGMEEESESESDAEWESEWQSSSAAEEDSYSSEEGQNFGGSNDENHSRDGDHQSQEEVVDTSEVISVARKTIKEIIKRQSMLETMRRSRKSSSISKHKLDRAQKILADMPQWIIESGRKDWDKDKESKPNARYQSEEVPSFDDVWDDAFWEAGNLPLTTTSSTVREGSDDHHIAAANEAPMQAQRRLTATHHVLVKNLKSLRRHNNDISKEMRSRRRHHKAKNSTSGGRRARENARKGSRTGSREHRIGRERMSPPDKENKITIKRSRPTTNTTSSGRNTRNISPSHGDKSTRCVISSPCLERSGTSPDVAIRSPTRSTRRTRKDNRQPTCHYDAGAEDLDPMTRFRRTSRNTQENIIKELEGMGIKIPKSCHFRKEHHQNDKSSKPPKKAAACKKSAAVTSSPTNKKPIEGIRVLSNTKH